MNIKINAKYHLTSDSKQYILHKKKGKNETKTFFTSIGSVVKSLINDQVKENDKIKTLKQLGKKIDEYAEEIKDCLHK